MANGTFTSVWDGGYEVTTDCKINTETKEVFNIGVIESEIEECDILDYEYITINGKDYNVYPKYECVDTQMEFWYE